MKNLVKADKRELYKEQPFTWYGRYNVPYKLKDMEDRHLFFTVRMIWNHAMPEEARTHEYRKYQFGSRYTPEYMKSALIHMIPELLNRDQSEWPKQWIDQLNGMIAWLNRNNMLPKPLQLLERK